MVGKVSIDKIDSETKQRIKGDAEFKISSGIPSGSAIFRQAGITGTKSSAKQMALTRSSTQRLCRRFGRFVLHPAQRGQVRHRGEPRTQRVLRRWTDVTKPGTAGSVLGKRAYAFEITKALDGQTIWLGNADYNADITTTNSGQHAHRHW